MSVKDLTKSVDSIRKFVKDHDELEGSPLWDELDGLVADIEYYTSLLEDEMNESENRIEELERQVEEYENA